MQRTARIVTVVVHVENGCEADELLPQRVVRLQTADIRRRVRRIVEQAIGLVQCRLHLRRQRSTVQLVQHCRFVLVRQHPIGVAPGRRGPEGLIPGLAAVEERRVGSARQEQIPGRIGLGRRTVLAVGLSIALGQRAA